MKHKQELAAVRSEMQKLVQESKSGLKGKDAAEKELEAAKKKLLDVETKLKAVLQDKQAIALVSYAVRCASLVTWMSKSTTAAAHYKC